MSVPEYLDLYRGYVLSNREIVSSEPLGPTC
jgi:hypothetical protein